MINIGITGQQGFIGSYIKDRLSLLKNEFTIIPFERDFFEKDDILIKWVKQCHVIIHLAALNRHSDAQVLHDTNVNLIQSLISACEAADHAPHIVFSSSTQEKKDNLYGQSKKKGRELLQAWAETSGARITGMVIPNVFGPFGKPFYNSVVATFCHQLCNGQIPVVDVDGSLQLIYVDELADIMIDKIRNGLSDANLEVKPSKEIFVSELQVKLKEFKEQYFDKGILPELDDKFDLQLFNTFRSFINHETYFPFKLTPHRDDRGAFVEIIRLNQGGQVSFSTTHAGITRGNHFHTRKIERFAVIKGKAQIQLRKYNSDKVMTFELNGDEPSYVDMPIWFTHNITNVGNEDLYTIFWINEFFNADDADTYFENV